MDNKRLLKIASYINPQEIIVDIGCDHALLPIYLVENMGVKNIVACDVNEGPLTTGLKNITKHGLEDNIRTILSDGFISVDQHFTTAVIAGMGGILISEIIESSIDKVLDKRLILQPNNSEATLRSKLAGWGFNIETETVVVDNGINYEIIIASKDGKYSIESDVDVLVGPVLKNLKSDENISKIESKIEHYKSFVDKVPIEKRKEIKFKLKIMEDTLCNLKR